MAYGTARLSVPIHVLRVLTKNGTQHDQARGRSRGGLSTNIHVLVDGLGNPWRVRRTAGQCHDRPQAAALLDGVLVERVIADRGYAKLSSLHRHRCDKPGTKRKTADPRYVQNE